MYKVIEGNTVNHVVNQAMSLVINEGDTATSRNGGVHQFNNVISVLNNPRARHLHLDGRKSNIFAMIAETFWIMAGDDKVDPYLSFFLKRAVDFSDDGKTWRGGYGPRLFNYETNQIQGVIDIIKSDGPQTRRAVADIYDSNKDSPSSLKKHYELDVSKDIPCNNMIHFYTEATSPDKLCMNLFQRSGDACWGWGSINLFEFSFLQEYIANEVGMDLGYYLHFITNLHVYEFTGEQVYKVLDNKNQDITTGNSAKMIFPEGGAMAMSEFFAGLIALYSKMILNEDQSAMELDLRSLDNYVQDHIPANNNLLFNYINAVTAYICNKKGFESSLTIDQYCRDTDFEQSLIKSSFRKFELEY